jgi:triphosphatase
MEIETKLKKQMSKEQDTALEIELKFLISPGIATSLLQLIGDFSDEIKAAHQAYLGNTYYDTEQRLLRQADVSLRTRSQNGKWEQTIKTAGKVVGGLHQRPEYNIPIAADEPDLSLFDPQIFAPHLSVTLLQPAILPVFTTHFKRHTWLVVKGGCEFEVVFDQGSIARDGEEVPIFEVEMEWVSGDVALMFAFAHQLVECSNSATPIRLGYQSKAARGYQLVAGRPLQPISLLGNIRQDDHDSLENALAKSLEYGLQFMQHHEQCFVDNPSLLALRRFSDGVALIRHCFWLFSMVVPQESSATFKAELKWMLQSFHWVEHSRQLEALKSKTGMYRKKLALNKSLLQLVNEESDKEPDLASVGEFFAQPRYNHFLLNLSQWILNKGWRSEPKKRQTEALNQATRAFLSESWQSLLQVMAQRNNLSIVDYISHQQQLKRSLLTGVCVGSLYDSAERNDFRMPWIDLSQGIDELKTLHLLQSLAAKVDDVPAINRWLSQQIESLLLAMEQSRKSAVKMPVYWQ